MANPVKSRGLLKFDLTEISKNKNDNDGSRKLVRGDSTENKAQGKND